MWQEMECLSHCLGFASDVTARGVYGVYGLSCKVPLRELVICELPPGGDASIDDHRYHWLFRLDVPNFECAGKRFFLSTCLHLCVRVG